MLFAIFAIYLNISTNQCNIESVMPNFRQLEPQIISHVFTSSQACKSATKKLQNIWFHIFCRIHIYLQIYHQTATKYMISYLFCKIHICATCIVGKSRNLGTRFLSFLAESICLRFWVLLQTVMKRHDDNDNAGDDDRDDGGGDDDGGGGCSANHKIHHDCNQNKDKMIIGNLCWSCKWRGPTASGCKYPTLFCLKLYIFLNVLHKIDKNIARIANAVQCHN